MGGFNLIKYFKDGGPLMWPILVCSVLAFMFTLERIVVLVIQRTKLSPAKFLDALDAAMKKHHGNRDLVVEDLLALCKKKGGVCAEIMAEGLTKYRQVKSMNLSFMDMKQWLTGAIEDRARIELPQLESHLGIISVAATVAPLLGLLGTVTGMIASFQVMAQAAGGAKPDELAGGISVALITTVGGLVVSIPSLVFYNAMKGALGGYVTVIEEAGIALIDTLMLEGPRT